MRGARSERHESLAGVDRDADLQLELGIAPIQLVDGDTHREGGSNGALRIVAVSDRRTEHRHHRVADELLDDAAEALDLRAHPREVGRQDRPDVLRVEALGAGREADEIREEDGDDLPLLEQALRLVGQRFRAGKAELRNRRVLLAALGQIAIGQAYGWTRKRSSFAPAAPGADRGRSPRGERFRPSLRPRS